MLPGGLFHHGERRRGYAFRPVDGALEMALTGAVTTPGVPAAVTAILAAALAEVGGVPATAEVVRDLAVGDRQYLARQLAAQLGRDPIWLTATCQACGQAFDFPVWQAELPVKEAGAGYPYAETPRGLRLRVPTGADQEAIAGLPDGPAVEALFARCRVGGDTIIPDEGSSGDLAAAEAAVEAVAPEVALAVLAACPACGAEEEIAVDPYLGLFTGAGEVFQEVHRLAFTYHWSEDQIPRDRRRLYLTLIDRQHGAVS